MSVSPRLLSMRALITWAARLAQALPAPLPLVQDGLARALGFADGARLYAAVAVDEAEHPLPRPLHAVLPPLDTAKTWAKRLADHLSAQGTPVALSQAQAAWAHAFGLSSWNGVGNFLEQAQAQRQDPWMVVDASTLASALATSSEACGLIFPSDVPLLRAWVRAVVGARDQGHMNRAQFLGALRDPASWQGYFLDPRRGEAGRYVLASVFPLLASWPMRAIVDGLTPTPAWVQRKPGQGLSATDRRELCTLLAARLPDKTGPMDFPLRFVAVEPDPSGEAEAVIHFASYPAEWERNGDGTTPRTLLEARLATSVFAQSQITIEQHKPTQWNQPWSRTIKAEAWNFPTWIGVEAADGSVRGCLGRDSQGTRFAAQAAQRYAEPAEAEAFVTELVGQVRDTPFCGWYREAPLDGANLDDVVAKMPASPQGQKGFLLYREGEWWSGQWSADHFGTGPSLSMSSVSDFHGGRVSQAKRAQRIGLDAVRDRFQLQGDYAVLEHALRAWRAVGGHVVGNREQSAPVKTVCDYWNSLAPAESRFAGYFRLYVWDADAFSFEAGDPNEPNFQLKAMLDGDGLDTWALFEAPGKPTVALDFYRGRAHNTRTEHASTQVYLVNGKPSYDIGLPLSQVDDAEFSITGLELLNDRLKA